MFLTHEYIKAEYQRPSKTGVIHLYHRKKTLLVFRCDNCNEVFKREKGSMDPKRVNNNYFHVCSNCNPKQFAQRKGVEQKKIWDMPAGTDLPIGKF